MSVEAAAADQIAGEEGVVTKAMWDVNAYRIGYGSDTITLPGGTWRTVLEGDVTTKPLALQDLQRRVKTEFIPRIQGQIGMDAWNRLTQNCQVALVDLAYNYGSITKKAIREAAKTGDPQKIADAILSSTKNDNERLLHVDNDPKKPLKTGKEYTDAQKERETLYKRRKREAALCTGSDPESSTQRVSERSGASFSFLGILFWAIVIYFGVHWILS